MENTALLIVDFQNDYFQTFKNAKFPLEKTEDALSNTKKLLESFRKKKMEVIYIKHEKDSEDASFFKKGTEGANIHQSIKPKKSEKVIIKNYPNSFLKTDLKEYLDKLEIKSIIVVGAMTHMCIDATIRAGSDFGYNCTVVSDACATKSLEFDGKKISSEFVHGTIMAALEFAYAKVVYTQNILKELSINESK